MSSHNTDVFGTMASTVDSQDQIEFLSSGTPSAGHIANQDLASGKMIGSAEECNGFYLLGPTIFPRFP
ncbi:uncharacterized protein G2W53_045130 [Senna tora]|uniref:Uncharacterized protein n=1 Tax=Senna tora TaxID=362788 RepID=A0A834SCY2_9FABA|nr:uncharacterized protein G2W53_045130 [Senna tora]